MEQAHARKSAYIMALKHEQESPGHLGRHIVTKEDIKQLGYRAAEVVRRQGW
jgi:hypothetical protein